MRSSRVLGVVVLAAMLALVVGGAAAAPYSATITADGAVGYWRLGDGSGTTTAANAGSGAAPLDGTYNAPKVDAPGLIPGDLDTAADFNGTSSQITGSGLNGVAGGNPFNADWTIEAWLTRDSVSSWSAVMSNNRGGTSAPLMTFIDLTGQLGINGAGVTANNVSVDLNQLTGVQQYLGKPVYAVVTKTGGNGNGAASLNVYANVDGVWLAPATGTNSGWALTPRDGYYIGRHADGGPQLHDGSIDEVAIYSSALSVNQALNHYYAAHPASYAQAVSADNPVGFWRLGEVSGATTAGSSGTALGTVNGTYVVPKTDAPGLLAHHSDSAAAFDGSTTYVQGGGLNAVGGGNPFVGDWTIEAWFVRDTADGDWEGVFSNNANAAEGYGAPIMSFFDGVSGRSRHWLGMNAAGSSAIPDIYVDLGQFGASPTDYLGKSVYAVMSLAAGQLTMYVNVDGVWLPSVTAMLGRVLDTNNDAFYIGRHYAGDVQLFDG
ncbi:hypothetical protein HQ576_06105, partial [bacterium]|nr:hypothetical protein [bacterium]